MVEIQWRRRRTSEGGVGSRVVAVTVVVTVVVAAAVVVVVFVCSFHQDDHNQVSCLVEIGGFLLLIRTKQDHHTNEFNELCSILRDGWSRWMEQMGR